MSKARTYTRTVVVYSWFANGVETHRFEHAVMADMYYTAALAQPLVKRIEMYMGSSAYEGALVLSHDKAQDL